MAKKHPGVAIEKVQVAGGDLDGEEPVTDWLSASHNHPLQVIISPLVEVTLLWHGKERTLLAMSSWGHKEFDEAARNVVITRRETIKRRLG
jgi:hypothetical protein